jgi:hypothetical protein
MSRGRGKIDRVFVQFCLRHFDMKKNLFEKRELLLLLLQILVSIVFLKPFARRDEVDIGIVIVTTKNT